MATNKRMNINEFNARLNSDSDNQPLMAALRRLTKLDDKKVASLIEPNGPIGWYWWN